MSTSKVPLAPAATRSSSSPSSLPPAWVARTETQKPIPAIEYLPVHGPERPPRLIKAATLSSAQSSSTPETSSSFATVPPRLGRGVKTPGMAMPLHEIHRPDSKLKSCFENLVLPFRIEPPEKWLLHRVKNGDKSVTCVQMGATKTVDIPEKTGHDVFTFGLGGCTAVALLTRHKDGSRTITMSHYPPVQALLHLSQTRQALAAASHASGDDEHQALVVAPGDWVKGKDDKYALEPNDLTLVNGLRSAIRAKWAGSPLEVVAYSECTSFGDSKAFILSVSASGEKIRYSGVGFGTCEF